MTTLVTRTLHLKKLRFRSGRDKEFVAPPLEELLMAVAMSSPALADRHYPTMKGLAPGTACCYLTDIKRRSSGDKRGVSFEVGVYTHGLETDQLSLGDGTSEPEVISERIVGVDGKPREILHRYWCVALGETLLIDYMRSSGGYTKLTPLLDFLFKYKAGRSDSLPMSELLDVAAPSFQAAVEAGGGIDRVILRVAEAVQPGQRMKLARKLSDLRDAFKGTRRLSVEWESDDERIDVADAEKIFKEFQKEDSPISNLVIKLKDGPDLTGASRFHEKQEIQVQVTPQGRLAVTEVIDGLWKYLDKLRQPNGTWRMIDDDGYVIKTPVKRQRSK